MKDRNFNKGNKPKNDGPRINEEIRLSECRLLGDDGHAYGVVSMDQAWRLSEELGLDLVEVSPAANPPVVKLIDYGKFKYEQQKKQAESKKKQLVIDIKEIQFRPHIDQHDLQTKLKHAEKFLLQGDKIKMVMQFRGREMAYRDQGMEKFTGIVKSVCEIGAIVESEAKLMGNRIIAMVAPDKKLIKQAQEKKQKEVTAKSSTPESSENQ